MNYDMLKLAVEGLSGGKNTIILDDRGMPSFMVRIPKYKNSDLISGATENIHPAFIVDGVEKDEILISKYQNIVKDDRAYSLPLMDPKVYVDFDQAKQYSENKGLGWHLLTNAERAAIALWCKKNGMPRGNNNYGSDYSAPHEKGIETYGGGDPHQTYRVATGSGPASWAHDGTTDGIYDLNGNVREWIGGMRLMDGEIQIIPYNNAAMHVNQDEGSTLWKAILEDGSIVDPGTAGTLKYDATNADGSGNIQIGTDVVNQTAEDLYASQTFETVAAKSGITVPNILKLLGLAPIDSNHGGGFIYMRNLGERLPNFGGDWSNSSGAGVFSLYLYSPRSASNSNLGFRSAYVDL
ncbi:MAG: FGE-sulfatase domain-containing protein [Thermoanaerobacterium thermosaccharolyticum]|jgi:hypothetical protein